MSLNYNLVPVQLIKIALYLEMIINKGVKILYYMFLIDWNNDVDHFLALLYNSCSFIMNAKLILFISQINCWLV